MASAMRRVSLRNLGAHKIRLVLTVISVVLGTAFVAGSFVFTDTLKGTFDSIFNNSLKAVDVGVAPVNARDAGVPVALVDTIKNVPGVKAVQLQASGSVLLIGSNGKVVHGGGAPSIGSIWSSPAERIDTPPTFVSGGPPEQAGQVVINESAATKAHLSTGDHTKVVLPTSGTIDVTISGVYTTKTATGGYIGVLFTKAQGLQLFTDGTHVSGLYLAGDPGVSETTLRDRVAKVLPANLEAKTGDQVRKDTQDAVQSALSFINYFLLAFGFIALIVGTFIIYNTFSMIVAQRLRELALLRAIGAGRGQVSRSVLLEASIIGLIGALAGLAGGIGLAYGLAALLDALGSGIPGGSLVLKLRTVIVALAVGIGVTLISAYAPARRAAKIPPVAAMRAEFASTGTSLRKRTLIGSIVGAIGVVATVGGALTSSAGSAASLIGLGLLFVGAGALMLSPVLAQLVIGGLSFLVRPFGAVGRLARTNAVRNPRRTAATAFALTMGLLLVSAIGVVGASTKTSINKLVDNNIKADYILTGTDNSSLPLAASQAASKVPGIADYVSIYDVEVTLNGGNASGSAVDGDLASVFDLGLKQGSPAITGTNMAISERTAADDHLKLGDQVTLAQPGGATRTVTVTGVYADNPLLGTWLVSQETFKALTPSNKYLQEVGLVKAAPGTNLSTLRTDLENATDSYYVVQVQDREEFKGQQANQINSLLTILYGLLGLAIVISVLGIINTLALSVVERRREIGMLRAIGAQRKQVRRTIQLESMLIAIFGASLGLVIGVVFGALFTHTLRGQGLTTISIPWRQDILFLVVAAVVGVLAALWPAVRAARTRPLEAISAE